MAVTSLGSKAECSIVKLNENGNPVDFCVAKQNSGSGRVLVVRKDCYDQREFNTYSGSFYFNGSLDWWFNNTYKKMLDPDIQAAICTTSISCAYLSGSTWTTISHAVSVFTLSASQLGLSHEKAVNEGSALSAAVIALIKNAKLNGSDVRKWTRSVATGTSRSAWYVNYGGSFNYSSFSAATIGVLPTFVLPATLMVDDDGTVLTNTAPTTPGSITIPAQINGGSTITVEWGASTDAEGNLEGYKVERSVDGGSAWTQIYQGTAQSTTNLVPFGSDSVMYRVKAYDTEGLESGWKTSAQVDVINNTAPTAPGQITVPEQVQGGQPLAIAWGESSDGEDNLAGYALERQVDGGDWAAVYSGSELSYTDQITKGWQTVAYRVRAYDAANAYSGFAVSETREVNNNTPPAITCTPASGTDLGVKSAGFAVPYSVSDEEGDEVTVTEAVDGAAWRTFAVELGASNSFQLTGLDFMRLLNGRHTLSITAADGASSAAHSLSFTKLVTAASVTLAQPMEADDRIAVCVLSVSGSIPADAAYTVEVTNNAKDNAPVWEDCTAAVQAGVNHVFANDTAANGFAFNFRVNASRGTSGAGGHITSVQGGFQ